LYLTGTTIVNFVVLSRTLPW